MELSIIGQDKAKALGYRTRHFQATFHEKKHPLYQTHPFQLARMMFSVEAIP